MFEMFYSEGSPFIDVNASEVARMLNKPFLTTPGHATRKPGWKDASRGENK